MSAISAVGGDIGALDTGVRVSDAIRSCAHILLRRVFRILRGCGFSEGELRDMATPP